MKRTDLLFAALLVPLDFAALWLAGWTAYSLRFSHISGILPAATAIPFRPYLGIIAIVAAVWVGILAIAGVYAVRQRPLSAELGRIFLGASTSVLLIIVTIFFRREFFTSRFIILAGWVLGVLFVWFVHILVRSIQRALLRRGLGVRSIVVFGNDATTNNLLVAFRAHPVLGFRVVQHFPDIGLESLEKFDMLLAQGDIDEAWIADPTIPKPQTLQLYDRCSTSNVVFKYAADIFDTQAGNIDIHDVAGVPVIEIKRTPLDGWGRILKRVVDLVGAVILIAILAIPCLLVAVMIKLDSAGPVFMRLDRVGQGQKKFRLWKFRSMVRDAQILKPQLVEQNERGDGPLFKIKNDPRITRVGRFIRRTSIDELPQLLNVVTGDMSLAGPRPHEPEEVARYEKLHKKLLAIKPGMTGMAQISGRSNLTFEDEVKLDLYYIEHWSLGLDLQIMLRTPAAVLNTRNAA